MNYIVEDEKELHVTEKKLEAKEINAIEDDIASLKNQSGMRYKKYLRNLRRYYYTPFLNLQNIANANVVGYWEQSQVQESELLDAPQVNVVKSCIDTLTSKIAQSKVRPYFNAINGTYKDIKLVKQCQHFFDLFFEKQNVNKLVSQAFKDACIFDTGCVWIDNDTNKLKRLLPHQVYIDNAEFHYDEVTRAYIELKDYPVSALPDFLKKKFKNEIKGSKYCDYGIFYDTEKKIKIYRLGSQPLVCVPYDCGVIPLVFLFYSEPETARSSQSVVDMLNSIQLQIDFVNARIAEALQLNPALTFFVPSQSNIKVSQLDNRIGKIVEYDPAPSGMGDPISSHTPAFIDASYSAERENLISLAYDMVGVSQLSAQAKKPTGVDSGKALLTLEDVESERFETQLNQVIRAYVDIARMCISCFPQDEYILPRDKYRNALKWGQIANASKMMSIQFSGADSLSKDPSTKLQQLQTLAQAGVIPSTMIARYMEIPDLEGGYSLATNANDAVDTIIDMILDTREIVIPDYIPFTLMKESVINLQLLLTASNFEKNKPDIELLQLIYNHCEVREREWTDTLNEASAELQQATSELGNVGSVLEQEANMVQQGTIPQQAQATEAPQGMEQVALQDRGDRTTGWDVN